MFNSGEGRGGTDEGFDADNFCGLVSGHFEELGSLVVVRRGSNWRVEMCRARDGELRGRGKVGLGDPNPSMFTCQT